MLQEKIEGLRREIELNPQDGRLRFQLFFFLLKVGEREEAQRELEAGYALNPNDPDIKRAYYSNPSIEFTDFFLPVQKDNNLPLGEELGFVFSPNTPRGVSLSSFGYLTLWDTEKFKPILQLKGEDHLFFLGEGPSFFLTFSPGEVHFRSYTSLEIHYRFPFESRGIEKGCYLEDQIYLLRKGELEIWKFQGNHYDWTPPPHSSFPSKIFNFSLSYSKKQVVLLSGQSASLWDSDFSEKISEVSLDPSLFFQAPTQGPPPLFSHLEENRAVVFLGKALLLDFHGKFFRILPFDLPSSSKVYCSPSKKLLLQYTEDKREWYDFREGGISLQNSSPLSPKIHSIKIDPPYGVVLKGEQLEVVHLLERKFFTHPLKGFRRVSVGPSRALLYRQKPSAFALIDFSPFQWKGQIKVDFDPVIFLLAPQAPLVVVFFEKKDQSFLGLYDLETNSLVSQNFAPILPDFAEIPLSHLRAYMDNSAQRLLVSSALNPISILLERNRDQWKVIWKMENFYLGAFLDGEKILMVDRQKLWIFDTKGKALSSPIKLPGNFTPKKLAISPNQNKVLLWGEGSPDTKKPYALFLVDLSKLSLSPGLFFSRPFHDLAFLCDQTFVVADDTSGLFFFRLL